MQRRKRETTAFSIHHKVLRVRGQRKFNCTHTRDHSRPFSPLHGFTLIELLVVVAIIALLVAILLPSLAEARRRAKDTLCLNSQHQLHLGMLAYAEDNADWLPSMIRVSNTGVRKLEEGTYRTRSVLDGHPVGLGLLYPMIHVSDQTRLTGPPYVRSLRVTVGCPAETGYFKVENDPNWYQYFVRYGHSYWSYFCGWTDDYPWGQVVEKSLRTKTTHPPDKTILTCRFVWSSWGPNARMIVHGREWHAHGDKPGLNRLLLDGSVSWVNWNTRMQYYWWQGFGGLAGVAPELDRLH